MAALSLMCKMSTTVCSKALPRRSSAVAEKKVEGGGWGGVGGGGW